jgi:hypothetical protein
MSDLTPASDELVAEIRARCEAASAGPWYWSPPNHVADVRKAMPGALRTKDPSLSDRDGLLLPVGVITGNRLWMQRVDEMDLSISLEIVGAKPDTDFIASARDDVPALLARIEADRAEIARLRGLIVKGSGLQARIDAEAAKLYPCGADMAELTMEFLNEHSSKDCEIIYHVSGRLMRAEYINPAWRHALETVSLLSSLDEAFYEGESK